jgi:iron complex transport system substrate-binding protein
VLLVACARSEPQAVAGSEPFRRTAGGNVVSGCVERFDPNVDYFPEKSRPAAAAQFTIEYHKHYKVLTVTPREDTTLRIRYALVQCGTPAPAGFDLTRIVQVPARRLAITHSDYHGAIDLLDLYDRVVAVGQERLVSIPRLRAGIAARRIAVVGSQQHLDLERLISLKPDIVLSYWSVSPEWNAPAKVDEVGLRSGALVGHWERTPLGALDWLKVLAAYVNREGDANAIVDSTAARYDSLRTLVKAAAAAASLSYITQPPARDRWALQRADHSAHARMYDAGIRYAFDSLVDGADFPSTSLEAALQHGRDADFWFDAPVGWRQVSDILAADARLGAFRAVQSRRVYSWQRGREAPDRVPWGEWWLVHPDRALADLIAATRPQLLPGHRFSYLLPLTEAP